MEITYPARLFQSCYTIASNRLPGIGRRGFILQNIGSAEKGRCHVKIGTPYFGDPGSLYSQRFRDPGPYSTESMGTPEPHFAR